MMRFDNTPTAYICKAKPYPSKFAFGDLNGMRSRCVGRWKLSDLGASWGRRVLDLVLWTHNVLDRRQMAVWVPTGTQTE